MFGRRGGRRRGLRPEPADGWPLDRVLVGVATLRTLRELIRQEAEGGGPPPRAWDLALRNGVTPQGSANSLERLREAGLVTALAPSRPGRAPAFRLDRSHPVVASMARLFEAERSMVAGRPTWRDGFGDRSAPRPRRREGDQPEEGQDSSGRSTPVDGEHEERRGGTR